MPSEVDQAAPQQSIQERLGSLFQGEMPAKAPAAEQPPEVDDSADDTETDQTESDDGEESAPQAEPAVEEVEVEVEGWKGKIPAKLKAEIDKAADFISLEQNMVVPDVADAHLERDAKPACRFQ